jgi:hypothetical protein
VTNDQGESICDLQVCGLGQATWFVLLLALSHVYKVSFVCSFNLMHVFRGILWVCASLLFGRWCRALFASPRAGCL